LLGRHPLQAGDEGEADRLLGLIANIGAGGAVGQALEHRVGVGLQPDRLAPAGRLRRVRRAVRAAHLPGPAVAGAQGVETAVGGDPVKPRAQRGPALEAGQPPPGGEQRLLDQVLGVLDRAEDAITVDLQLAAVRIGQLPEGVLVAAAGALERGVDHRLILPTSATSSGMEI
jgi:hypothetical protein